MRGTSMFHPKGLTRGKREKLLASIRFDVNVIFIIESNSLEILYKQKKKKKKLFFTFI